MSQRFLRGACAVLASVFFAAGAQAADVKMPSTVVWTAYQVGGAGYSQVVAIGSVFKQRYNVNLRALPGRNDVSRLSPLRSGQASFSATGSDSIYAQEGVFIFGNRDWGPQTLRMIMISVADGCAVSMVIAGDSDIRTMADLKGKRVTWVRAAPALNKAVESMLAHAGLTWNDVRRVDVSSTTATIDAILNGDADAGQNATFSTINQKLAAAPRGIAYVPVPNGSDEEREGWKRLNSVVPWYFPHRCTDGPGVPEDGIDGVATPYPVLISTDGVDDDLVYATTRAMYLHYDDYKDAAPGANGWARDRQRLANSFLPFHEGAIRYYKESGMWDAAAQENHDAMLQRQEVLTSAWAEYTKDAPRDAEGFAQGWMKARAAALEAAGLPVVFDEWEISG